MITKSAKVWLGGAGGITLPITISQYDTGWEFAFSIYNGSVLYDPGVAVAVTLEGDKPDGTAFSIPGTFADGVATFDGTGSVSAAAGTVACELRVSVSGETVGTANFNIIVEEAPLAQHVTSEDNFAAMQALLDEVSQDAAAAAQAAGTAAQTVLDQAPTMVSNWLAEHVDPETGYVIDDSLTIAGAAADAKATGDEIGELKSAVNEIASLMPSETSKTTGTEITTSGYYWDLSGTTAVLTATEKALAASTAIAVEPGDTVDAQGSRSGSSTVVQRFYAFLDSEYHILSTAESGSSASVSISATAPANAAYIVFTTPNTGTTARTINYTISHTEYVDIPAYVASAGKPLFYYSNPSGYAGGFNVLYQNKSDYLRFSMLHVIDQASNCNVWHMHKAIAANANRNTKFDITVGGEWECAIKLLGRSDFSGGSAHGDEVLTSVHFIVDGEVIDDITAYTAPTTFTELRIVRTSNLYDPADSETIIAEHGCEYIFSDGKLIINQSVKWLVESPVTLAYLAMHMPSKAKTDTHYDDTSFNATTYPSDNYSLKINNAKQCAIYGDAVLTHFRILEYPTGYNGGDCLILTDNGGLSYNKAYFVVITDNDGVTIPVGTLWKSTSEYAFSFE